PASDWGPPPNDVPPAYDEGPPDPYDSGPPPGYDATPQQAPAAPREAGRAVNRAREAIQQTRTGDAPAVAEDDGALADAAVSRDDEAVDDTGMDSTELLRRTLGAQVIEEIPHS